MNTLRKFIVSLAFVMLLPTAQAGAPTLITATAEDSKPAAPSKNNELQLKIDTLAACESGDKYNPHGNPWAINWEDGGSPSYGILQYKLATLSWFTEILEQRNVLSVEFLEETREVIEELRNLKYGSKMSMELGIRLAYIEVRITQEILKLKPSYLSHWSCAAQMGLL